MKQNETDIKGQVKDYLGYKHIFNYPNTAGLGCYPGLPDRVIHYRGEVIYLEIKKPKGKQSEHQINFENQCHEDGIKYFVIRSIEDLQAVLSEADGVKTYQ